MELKLEFGASHLELTDKGLTVHVARWYFTPKQWGRLQEMLARACERLGWLALPFQASEQAGARWKKIGLDGFSLIVYVLLIEPEHKLVKLLQVIDWGEIDQRCAEVYENAERGARAYAPQVLFRMLLLMALYGLSFESSLVRQIEGQVVWRWFCGFGMLTAIPRTATLCYFRQRLGADKFVEILVWLIQQCNQAGMIGWDEGYFDFTGVATSATQLTPYQRVVVLAKALEAYVVGLDDGSIVAEAELRPVLRQLVVEAAKTVLSEAHKSVAKLSPQSLSRSLDRLDENVERMPRGPRWWQQIRQELNSWWQRETDQVEYGQSLLHCLAAMSQDTDQRQASLKALKEHLCQVGRALTPSVPHAWGDLSARVGTLSAGRSICGYLAGYLVDSKCNVIIGLLSVPANTAQAPQVKIVVDKVKNCLGRLPKRLGLDSAFDRKQVYLDLKGEPLETFIVSRSHRTRQGIFAPELFVFNEVGQLCCPRGSPMQLKYGPYENDRAIYEGVECASCQLRGQCVPEDQPARRLQIDVVGHRRWLENRAKSHSIEGQRILKQRFAREGVFGHANTYHNGDRAPYRDGAMNAIADCLTAFAVNLERLATHQPQLLAA